jgi:hypothetical protein
VEFHDLHVYHFAPVDLPFSFSHIVILNNGDLRIFRAINCRGRGETLDDVVEYVTELLKDRKDLAEIITRIKDYRKYGMFFTVDDDTIRCQQ